MDVLKDAKKRSPKAGVKGLKPSEDFEESALGESIEEIRERKTEVGDKLVSDLKKVKGVKRGVGDTLIKSLKGLDAPKVKTYTPKFKARK